jgi:RNA recognition motif-containing protein
MVSGRSNVLQNNSAALRAIELLSGKELNGRPLTVNEARPKADRGSGGGTRQNNRW